MRSMVAFLLLISMVPSTRTCYGLTLPRDAVILVPFAPIGRYAGHWGVDIAAAAGSSVITVGSGTVSFAGEVAGRRSVTIDHGGGIRTSYSYLSRILVDVGESVVTGATVGSAGVHDGRDAFHLSLRRGATYLDPLVFGRCSQVPEPALWLAMARHGYPVARDRNSRGYVRPTTHRSSCHGSSGL
jgi:hypothetical protein